jgi:hypothetical protein
MWRKFEFETTVGQPDDMCRNCLYSHVMLPELTRFGAARLKCFETNQRRSTGKLYEYLQEPLKGLFGLLSTRVVMNDEDGVVAV